MKYIKLNCMIQKKKIKLDYSPKRIESKDID